MKLSPYIILDELSDFISSSSFVSDPNTYFLSYANYIDSLSNELKENIIYIIENINELNASDFNKQITFITKRNNIKNINKCNYIYIKEEVNLLDIVNKVNEIFNKYNQWEEKIQNAITQGHSISSLFNLIEEVINNPIIIEDCASEILYSHIPNTKMQQYNDYIKKYPLSHKKNKSIYQENMKTLFKYDNFKKIADCHLPTLFYNEQDKINTLHQNIFIKNELVAKICIDEVFSVITNKDYCLLNTICSYIKQLILLNRIEISNQPKIVEKIIRSLLSENIYNIEEIKDVLTSFSWNFDDEYVILALTHNNSLLINSSLNFIASTITYNLQNSYYYHFDNYTLILVNLSLCNSSINHIVNKLNSIDIDYNVSIGISSISNNIFNLKELSDQAIFTANNISNSSSNIGIFENFQLNYFFTNYAKTFQIDSVIPKGIYEIIKYDNENQTNLLQILETYLNNDRNIALCAKLLYLHRNTFIYKLEKIKQVSSLDFNNSSCRLKCLISIELLKRKHQI